MFRALLLPTLLCASFAFAQDGDKPKTVVKSDAVEMKAAPNTVTSSVSSAVAAAPPRISGDFTLSSAHPKCVEKKTTGERVPCTADAVLQHIQTHLKAVQPKGLDLVSVDFDVDTYGDVKAIKTNAGAEVALGNALIVALYELPKFEIAQKGAAKAASHCSFSYPVAELFAKGEAAPATATAEANAAATSAAAVPALTTVNSKGQLITGDFTTGCAHPKCTKSKTPEERTACTAAEVLAEIKQRLKAEQPAYLDKVVVDFDVDVYGDVKTIRANCSSEPELGKAVIVALYGLPKFEAARKGDARATAHCTFTYPSSDLFAKP